MRSTKVVATIGPASQNDEHLTALLKAGVNVFRFNMKHGTPAWHGERMKKARLLAEQLPQPLGIMIDLQGPELRIETSGGQPIRLEAGAEVELMAQPETASPVAIIVSPEIIARLKPNDRLLINDGTIELEVVEHDGTSLLLRTSRSVVIESHKNLHIPGLVLNQPALTDNDLVNLDLAKAVGGVDFIALSFIRTPADLGALHRAMLDRDLHAHVVAKIENAQALTHLDEIIHLADAVMVARGDLGIEVPYEQLAYWQKVIISKSREAGKPVITATQMLGSMVGAVRPTRAEVTDVANAVFDGTDAVMLSEETAIGADPLLVVETMAKIAAWNDGHRHLPPLPFRHALSKTETISRAALGVLEEKRDFPIEGIVVVTQTGATVRALARFRLTVPVVGLTEDSRVRNQLTLVYGVQPVLASFPEGSVVHIEGVLTYVRDFGLAQSGEHWLVIHGPEWKNSGQTNTLVIGQVP